MTFCLGISLEKGIVALADTMVVKGDERLNKGKLEVLECQGRQVFVMTSGLRSVRDKAVVYFREWLQNRDEPVGRLYMLANVFGECLRRVREEDESALRRDGLSFNTHAIIGGRMPDDSAACLFYLYPAGNWIEANADSPYFIIGRTMYGKPILDRLLGYGDTLGRALNLGFLAFDATRTSVIDVDYPLEVLLYDNDRGTLAMHRFTEQELLATNQWWTHCLSETLGHMSVEWAAPLLETIGEHAEEGSDS